MSKRGNVYLRRMLIHGARAVLFRIKYDTGGFGQWVHRLAQRAPRNKVVVAIANKLARIAWAVLSSGKNYQHQPLQMICSLMAVEKTLRLESAERFPLFHRHDGELEPRSTTVCGAEKETKEQSNGVSENLVAIMRPS